jgi:hypothetical protein
MIIRPYVGITLAIAGKYSYLHEQNLCYSAITLAEFMLFCNYIIQHSTNLSCTMYPASGYTLSY